MTAAFCIFLTFVFQNKSVFAGSTSGKKRNFFTGCKLWTSLHKNFTWKFYTMCAGSGSSEPSLVANSIGTQISYNLWFKFCMCLQEVKWTIVLLWERERKNVVFYIFIFIFFDTSLTFYASMFCDSGPYMHCRLCDSFFHHFLPRLIKWVRPILRYSLSNGLDLDQGRRSVGPG